MEDPHVTYNKKVICTDCNRKCRSQDCLKAHKQERKTGRGKNKGKTLPSFCQQIWQCNECGVTIQRHERNPHIT